MVTLIIKIVKSNGTSDDDLYKVTTDQDYRNYIYKTINSSSRHYIDQIFRQIDEINRLINQFNIELTQAYYNSMSDIFKRANDIENLINQCWYSNQFKKTFSFYIGLHYASHLLANAIKAEQRKIRDTFVRQKNRRDHWDKKINSLKEQQQKASSSRRALIGKDIADSCRMHQSIAALASQIGEMNTKYNERVTYQNNQTGKRRDFIAEHFGEKGERWKDRMHERAIFSNSGNEGREVS